MIDPFIMIGFVLAILLIMGFIYAITRYVRCPSNRILVVYGHIGGDRAARCIHGGGALVLPVIQDYMYLSLEPMRFELETTTSSADGSIVDIIGRCSVVISTTPEIMQNAAERLLGLPEKEIAVQAAQIISVQIRLTAADRDADQLLAPSRTFVDTVREAATIELNTIGLEIVTLELKVTPAAAEPTG